MGLFSLFGSPKPKPKPRPTPPSAPAERPFLEDPSIQRAVLAPVICAMVSDGQINALEEVELSTICKLSPVFQPMPKRQIDELIAAAKADLKERGAETVVREAAAVLSGPLRETSFCFAAQMVVADSVINAHEFAALDALRRWLEIDEARARQINDVMMIMLRPATA